MEHGLRPKKLLASVAVPPAPLRVPSRRPFTPSVASVSSVGNDKGDSVQISWYLSYSWGKPQKTSARRPSDEGAVRPVIVSSEVPFLQKRSARLNSTPGRGWLKIMIYPRRYPHITLLFLVCNLSVYLRYPSPSITLRLVSVCIF